MKKTGIRPILDRKGGLIGMHGSLPSTSTNSPQRRVLASPRGGGGGFGGVSSSSSHKVESARQVEIRTRKGDDILASSLRKFSKDYGLGAGELLHRPKASKKQQQPQHPHHFKGRSGSTCDFHENLATLKNPNNSVFVLNNPKLTSDEILAEIHQQRRKHQSKSPLGSNRASYETLSPKYSHPACSSSSQKLLRPSPHLVKSAFSLWDQAQKSEQKTIYFPGTSPSSHLEVSTESQFTHSHSSPAKRIIGNLEESEASTAPPGGRLNDTTRRNAAPPLTYVESPARYSNKNKIIDYLDMEEYERFQNLRESGEVVEIGSRASARQFAFPSEHTGTFSKQQEGGSSCMASVAAAVHNDLSFSDSLQSISKIKPGLSEKSSFLNCVQAAIGYFDRPGASKKTSGNTVAGAGGGAQERREMSSIDGHESGFMHKEDEESPEYDRELEEEMGAAGQKSRNVFLKEEDQAQDTGSLEFNFRDQRGIEIGRSSLSDSAKMEGEGGSTEGRESEMEYLRSHYQKCLNEFEEVARRYDVLHHEHENLKIELEKARDRENRFIEQNNQFFRLYEFEHQLNQRNSVLINSFLKNPFAGEMILPPQQQQRSSLRGWRSSATTREHSPSFNASGASAAQMFLQTPMSPNSSSQQVLKQLSYNLSPKQREELVVKMQLELKQKDKEIQLLKDNLEGPGGVGVGVGGGATPDCQIHSEPSYNPSHRQSFHTLPGYMPQPLGRHKDEVYGGGGGSYFQASSQQQAHLPPPPSTPQTFYAFNPSLLSSYSNPTTATVNKSASRKPPVPKPFSTHFSPEVLTRNNLYTRTPAPLVLSSQDQDTMRNTQEVQGAQHPFSRRVKPSLRKPRSEKKESTTSGVSGSFVHESKSGALGSRRASEK